MSSSAGAEIRVALERAWAPVIALVTSTRADGHALVEACLARMDLDNQLMCMWQMFLDLGPSYIKHFPTDWTTLETIIVASGLPYKVAEVHVASFRLVTHAHQLSSRH